MNIVFFIDAIGLIFVMCAIVIVLANCKKKNCLFPFVVFLGLLALELFHFVSNTLEWSGITSRFDEVEDFIAVLEPVFWVFFFQAFLDLRITEDLKRTVEEKEVLLKEVHHRVKNNLLTLYSLVNLQQISVEGKRGGEWRSAGYKTAHTGHGESPSDALQV